MKKRLILRWWSTVVVMVVASLFVPSFPSKGAADTDTIKVGSLSPLTGPAALWGQGNDRGMQLWAEDVKNAGGLKVGNKRYNVEIVTYDHKYEVGTSISLARRLVFQDKVKFVAVLGGSICISCEPIFSKEKVILVGSCATWKYLGKDRPLTFRTQAGYMDGYNLWWPWLRKNYPDVKSVILMHPDDETGLSQAEAEQKALKKVEGINEAGLKLVARSLTDFYPVLTTIMATNPDAISISLPPGQAAIACKQARELRYKGKLLLPYGPAELIVKAMGAEAAEGILLPVIAEEPVTPKAEELVKRYIAKWGKPVSVTMPDGYFAGWLLGEGIQIAGTVDDVDAIAKAMLKADTSKSNHGKVVWYGENEVGIDHAIIRACVAGEIHNGTIKILGTIRP